MTVMVLLTSLSTKTFSSSAIGMSGLQSLLLHLRFLQVSLSSSLLLPLLFCSCAFPRFHPSLPGSAPFCWTITCTHMASALHLDCQPYLFTMFKGPGSSWPLHGSSTSIHSNCFQLWVPRRIMAPLKKVYPLYELHYLSHWFSWFEWVLDISIFKSPPGIQMSTPKLGDWSTRYIKVNSWDALDRNCFAFLH